MSSGSAQRAIAISCALSACLAMPAHAQNARAKEIVLSSEAGLQSIEAKFPAVKDLANVVSTDCATKLPEQAKIDGYCECGAAITFGLWWALGDEGKVKMKQKIAAYVNNPTPAGAAEFLNYQGPELYKPTCDLAIGRH